MRSVPLSAESNHLKVTSTPEPLSLTISIFIYLRCSSRMPGSRSRIGRSRNLAVSSFRGWIFLVSVLYFYPSFPLPPPLPLPRLAGSHVKFTQAEENSDPGHDMFCHPPMQRCYLEILRNRSTYVLRSIAASRGHFFPFFSSTFSRNLRLR